MRTTVLLAAGMAALVLFTGTVAALPGNAPVDVGANDAAADDAGRQAAAADGGGAAEADDRGPPASLPAPVP
ncbi:MAG: hypothetical protein ABEJ30_06015, partial [Halorientalis sp.]